MLFLPQGKKKMQTLQKLSSVVKGLKWAQVKCDDLWPLETSLNGAEAEREESLLRSTECLFSYNAFEAIFLAGLLLCLIHFGAFSFPAGTLEMEWKMEVMRGQPSADEAHCSSALGLGSCKKNTACSHTHLDLESYQQSRKIFTHRYLA